MQSSLFEALDRNFIIIRLRGGVRLSQLGLRVWSLRFPVHAPGLSELGRDARTRGLSEFRLIRDARREQSKPRFKNRFRRPPYVSKKRPVPQ